MPQSALTGSRIRERRQSLRIKQADLARQVGISASYLNLIEHNRRRIGGKVLVKLAQALRVDITILTQGAEETLLEGLREAVVSARRSTAEIDRIEEFVARFPGWAQLIAAQRRRMVTQERTIEALNDRLTHDPFLAEAMHDLLSNVTAIRATASILAQTPEIEEAWRDRFHRNMLEESDRLAEGSQALVSYFDRQVGAETAFSTPQEALESVLLEHDYHLPMLETGGMEAAAALLDKAPQLAMPQARALALAYFRTYVRDAEALPMRPLQAAFAEVRDPAQLARRFDVALPVVMHRLACLPKAKDAPDVGLVVADTSGSLLFRKGIDGFPIPRFGAACSLWSVYQALTQPVQPIRVAVETPPGRRFVTYAVSELTSAVDFDAPQVFRSWMLVLDAGNAPMPEERARPIGTTCRICPRDACAARREPSILAD
ncbi:transcriptional regulator [Dinoroseobacter shibae DFL 12 = DSM 16493]|jgi:transcriptional regulator with XRE-family HTH domain|uniref:Transcriptional regulator n=1 Tax=Dinoroseobacter shibae (strain DSM 16493 / NCIMB 14021 / DFL 12) TaxID=398580 RepID=A8LJC5_DINSH|nr:helix-turn-helix transcriptional regulator [Dinoroseobacter shibae]ABV93147.1 transcriptional regulator [Dinoroseobacter shibae DFL 12 = DSM 16493]URF48072.1 short-chain fatty acyl-CoA regulator family protein [Dinoroseobacter shibae]URF52382.1 short-chain fatty acyl-CoA regulator family protein [Dinoroseobacter shibae]